MFEFSYVDIFYWKRFLKVKLAETISFHLEKHIPFQHHKALPVPSRQASWAYGQTLSYLLHLC